MSNPIHDYNPAIKTVDTVCTEYIGMTAYRYKGEVFLNGQQATKVIGKNSDSLFFFLGSLAFRHIQGHNGHISETSYYTNPVEGQGGKKPRIVSLKYVMIYWIYQAFERDNITAMKLLQSL